ncbi:LPS export ABC transporter permease LptF [Palleronia rufa]|uniref:LPS export ABC transporter permease LptF n=1 Tax=Palleronia rufa TaxID=1530186 RepID=UPI00055CC079|nr:LPS export ABC transporter permease LptF [Palleronia rufa]
MRTFDRYLLSQLLTLFGFFSLVLVAVYWINRALLLFDRLIQNGHSAAVFLEFSALALPNVIRVVLPIAAFAAAVYATNRMRGDSELVVIQASGISPLRGARAVAGFGVMAGAVTMILTHVLAPMASGRLDQRSAEIAEDVTAGLLTEGQFLNPGNGVTLFIGEITPAGELRSVFLADRRAPGTETVYTAERALLLRRDDGPRLVMFDGMSQRYDPAEGRLGTTRFDDFSFDVSDLVDIVQAGPRDLDQIGSAELLTAPDAVRAETGAGPGAIALTLHKRTTQGAQALVAPVLGFAVMLLGGFSRFAAWRQVAAALVALVVYDLGDNLSLDAVGANAAAWPLLYLPTLAALAVAVGLLIYAGQPTRRKATAAPA